MGYKLEDRQYKKFYYDKERKKLSASTTGYVFLGMGIALMAGSVFIAGTKGINAIAGLSGLITCSVTTAYLTLWAAMQHEINEKKINEKEKRNERID